MSELQDFLDCLCAGLNEDERHVGNAFPGDPKSADKTAWRVRAIERGKDGWRFPGNASFNRYVSVAAFRMNPRGEWMRQKTEFSSAAGLMIDDVGKEVGGSVKLSFAQLNGLPPTYIIETSPGNFQFWYMFTERVRDAGKFEWLITNFIHKISNGIDPGMSGVTRVGRTPDSVNGKPENRGWQVNVALARPERRYSIEVLSRFWGLGPVYSPHERAPLIVPEDCSGRVANFELVLEMLKLWGHNKKGKTGLFKGKLDPDDFNMNGWMEIVCPWVHEHTGAADNGAAIQMPLKGNLMLGGFKCHHGHHFDNKSYKDVLRYVLDTLDDDYVAKTAKLLTKINLEWQNGKRGSYSVRQHIDRSGRTVGGSPSAGKF